MGNCVNGTGDNSDPDPKGDLYLDVPIGGTFEHPGYCDYNIAGKANCSSAEFVHAGNSGTKCICNGACEESLCSKKNCRRVSYIGDPTQCCIKSAKTLGHGQTCDPKYRSYANNNCDVAMDQFCRTGDNLFTNPNCVSWFNQRGEAATATLEAVCTDPANLDKPQCGCISARKDILSKFPSGSKVAVECIDNRCTNGGWKTFQMKQNPCNIVNCEMNISDLKLIANAPVGNYSPAFVQQCKNEKDAIESGAKPTQVIPTPTVTDTTLSAITTNKLAIGVTIGIIILLIIILVIYRRRRSY